MKASIYIFGAGQYGREYLEYLRQFEKIKIAAFIDNNTSRQTEKINGVECISVEEAVKRGAQTEPVLVSVLQSDEIVKQLKKLNFTNIVCVGEWIKKQKYFTPKVFEKSDYVDAKPFNYFESPYPDIVEIHKNEKEIFDQNKEVLEINFNVERQLQLAIEMKDICLPEWSEKRNESTYRYYYGNSFFCKGSADILYYMIRIVKPKKIIEVGSGFSTAVMLDTNEFYFSNEICITAIEPRTERLKALLKPEDNITIYEKELQEIPLTFFEMLEEGDFLFIDSSHVSKINSDVNYLFFEILPRLKKGVYIHFHDIFYPFIYPRQWCYEGRAYNEMYLLRAFLMNNNNYSIQFFGEMLEHTHKEKMCDKLVGNCSGSIWIRKDANGAVCE